MNVSNTDEMQAQGIYLFESDFHPWRKLFASSYAIFAASRLYFQPPSPTLISDSLGVIAAAI